MTIYKRLQVAFTNSGVGAIHKVLDRIEIGAYINEKILTELGTASDSEVDALASYEIEVVVDLIETLHRYGEWAHGNQTIAVALSWLSSAQSADVNEWLDKGIYEPSLFLDGLAPEDVIGSEYDSHTPVFAWGTEILASESSRLYDASSFDSAHLEAAKPYMRRGDPAYKVGVLYTLAAILDGGGIHAYKVLNECRHPCGITTEPLEGCKEVYDVALSQGHNPALAVAKHLTRLYSTGVFSNNDEHQNIAKSACQLAYDAADEYDARIAGVIAA